MEETKQQKKKGTAKDNQKQLLFVYPFWSLITLPLSIVLFYLSFMRKLPPFLSINHCFIFPLFPTPFFLFENSIFTSLPSLNPSPSPPSAPGQTPPTTSFPTPPSSSPQLPTAWGSKKNAKT